MAIARFFPLQVKRRGVELRLVIEGNGASAPRADQALLKAVARPRRWFDDLVSGRAQSIAEIAQREGITGRYVRRMLRLAFLAPEIVEAIAQGRQPPDLTTEALTQRIDLPLDWTSTESSSRCSIDSAA
jgi:site-specific DNA recombinase